MHVSFPDLQYVSLDSYLGSLTEVLSMGRRIEEWNGRKKVVVNLPET